MGLDLLELHFMPKTYVHMYVCNIRMYVHPPDPTDSDLCVGPSFGNFQVPPPQPPAPTPWVWSPRTNISIIFA